MSASAITAASVAELFPCSCSHGGSGSQAQAIVAKTPSEADVEIPTRLASGDGSHDEAGTTRHGPSPLSNSLSSVQPRRDRRVRSNLHTAPGLVVVTGPSGPCPVRSVPKKAIVSESIDMLIAKHEAMILACKASNLPEIIEIIDDETDSNGRLFEGDMLGNVPFFAKSRPVEKSGRLSPGHSDAEEPASTVTDGRLRVEGTGS